jgi:ribosomal protein L9
MILIVTKEHRTQETNELQEVGKEIDVTRPYAKYLIKKGLAKKKGKPTLLQQVAEKTGLKKKKKSKGPWHKSNPKPDKQQIELPAEDLKTPNENEDKPHK